jgi:hypothetical protein
MVTNRAVHLVRLSLIVALGIAASAAPPAATSLLFIGNSFTFGEGSAVHFWRANTVTDLNDEGIGGVPALFKAFTAESGLDFDVFLETHPGVGLDWHLANKRAVLSSRPFDIAVMHGYSTLDANKPGDPAMLIETTKTMADVLSGKSPKIEIYTTATWSRADQTYPEGRPWFGKPIETMALDVRAGYDKAATTSPSIKAVVPVGEAWNRAFKTGVADSNPYDGIDAGKIDLWTNDNYHASSYGYYLEALMVFGAVTHRDPRGLGGSECAGYELGLSTSQVRSLQQVAFDQLSSEKAITLVPTAGSAPARSAGRCK